MNLKSLLRIAKTVAPVVVPVAATLVPVVKAAVAKEKARPKP